VKNEDENAAPLRTAGLAERLRASIRPMTHKVRMNLARIYKHLQEEQFLPSVIEDGRAFRYASNAALAFAISIAITWAAVNRIDTPILTALLHLVGIVLRS
jgi:hypothetical protein